MTSKIIDEFIHQMCQYGPDEYTVLPINVLESLLRTFGYVLTKTKNNTL